MQDWGMGEAGGVDFSEKERNGAGSERMRREGERKVCGGREEWVWCRNEEGWREVVSRTGRGRMVWRDGRRVLCGQGRM